MPDSIFSESFRVIRENRIYLLPLWLLFPLALYLVMTFSNDPERGQLFQEVVGPVFIISGISAMVPRWNNTKTF